MLMPVVVGAAVTVMVMFTREHFFIIVLGVFVAALLAVMIEIVGANQTQATEDRDEGLPKVTQLFVGEKSGINDNQNTDDHPGDRSPLTMNAISRNERDASRTEYETEQYRVGHVFLRNK